MVFHTPNNIFKPCFHVFAHSSLYLKWHVSSALLAESFRFLTSIHKILPPFPLPLNIFIHQIHTANCIPSFFFCPFCSPSLPFCFSSFVKKKKSLRYLIKKNNRYILGIQYCLNHLLFPKA